MSTSSSLHLGEPIETFVFLKVVEEQNECNEVLEKYVWVPPGGEREVAILPEREYGQGKVD